jgi:Protein of unknown function (DUF3558)
MRRRLTLITAAAMAVALAACTTAGSPGPSPAAGGQGGGGAPASQTATATGAGAGGGGGATVSDPCTLLTQAEVSAVVGKQVGPGSSADNPNSCDFQYPPDGVPDIQAGVDFIDGSLGDYCKDAAGASALGMSIEPVDGLGDGACFIYVGSLQVGSSLTFAKDGRVFQTFALLGSGKSIGDIKAAATTLAQDALKHL